MRNTAWRSGSSDSTNSVSVSNLPVLSLGDSNRSFNFSTSTMNFQTNSRGALMYMLAVPIFLKSPSPMNMQSSYSIELDRTDPRNVYTSLSVETESYILLQAE